MIQSVEANFRKPVFVGDVLTVTGKVAELYEEANQIKVQVTIVNQDGEKVCKGILKTGILS